MNDSAAAGRVVGQLEELRLDDVPDHVTGRGVPSSWALMKSPAAGMNVSSVPATTPGQRERQRHAQERLRVLLA